MTRRTESGNAMLEVLVLGLILLGPLLWLLTSLAAVHRAALATSSAAREGAFEAARAPDAMSARNAIDAASARALEDAGLDPARVRVTWDVPAGWPRGGEVAVKVSYQVPVMPPAFLGEITPSVGVSAVHVAEIDPFRSR